MSYSPDRHRRHSIRLRGYDYAQASAYFVTLCVQDRAELFGRVVGGAVELSEIGRIVGEEWERTPALRPNVELDTFVVMPDHLHGIVVIVQRNDGAAAPQATRLRSPAQSLGAIVRGFKAAVVQRAGTSLWQRNYYEHIIRDDADLDRIRHYITANPARWEARRSNDGR